MIDIGFFYLMLLVLFLLLLFVIILYSGAHSRIIAPPLMNDFYQVSNITNSWQDLNIVNRSGLSIVNNETSFAFEPLGSDRSRKLNGKMLLYAQSQGTSQWFQLQLKDTGDSNKIVGDATNYVLYPGTCFGLQTIQLNFSANNLENSNEHNFVLQAKGREGTTTINGTSILINSAYFTYI